MAANNNWVRPAGDQARYVINDNGFTEDDATKDIADGAVG